MKTDADFDVVQYMIKVPCNVLKLLYYVWERSSEQTFLIHKMVLWLHWFFEIMVVQDNDVLWRLHSRVSPSRRSAWYTQQWLPVVRTVVLKHTTSNKTFIVSWIGDVRMSPLRITFLSRAWNMPSRFQQVYSVCSLPVSQFFVPSTITVLKYEQNRKAVAPQDFHHIGQMWLSRLWVFWECFERAVSFVTSRRVHHSLGPIY